MDIIREKGSRNKMEKRHTCTNCKKKRFEKFMINTERLTRYQKEVWACDNDFCIKHIDIY